MITKALIHYTSSLCLTTAIAIMVVPAVSQAGGEEAPVLQKAVSHAGLDLNTDQGARAFYTRLRAAALSVCYATESAIPGSYSSDNPCVKKAIGDAVRAVNRPQVTQLYVAVYRSNPAPTNSHLAIASAAHD
jgi:UrcA family protein